MKTYTKGLKDINLMTTIDKKVIIVKDEFIIRL